MGSGCEREKRRKWEEGRKERRKGKRDGRKIGKLKKKGKNREGNMEDIEQKEKKIRKGLRVKGVKKGVVLVLHKRRSFAIKDLTARCTMNNKCHCIVEREATVLKVKREKEKRRKEGREGRTGRGKCVNYLNDLQNYTKVMKKKYK